MKGNVKRLSLEHGREASAASELVVQYTYHMQPYSISRKANLDMNEVGQQG